MSGVDAIKAIRRQDPRARIVVLTMHNGEEYIHRALQAGAATYLLKDTCRTICRGHPRRARGPTLAPDVEARLAERAGNAHLRRARSRSLQLDLAGDAEQGDRCDAGISFETAQVHVKNILAKLKVQDRTAAVERRRRRRDYPAALNQ